MLSTMHAGKSKGLPVRYSPYYILTSPADCPCRYVQLSLHLEVYGFTPAAGGAARVPGHVG